MTEQIDFGPQAAVLAFAARLAGSHPGLPGPGLSSSPVFPNRLMLCLDSPGEVEAWREALHVPPSEIRFETRSGDRLLVGFNATVEGFEVDAFALFGSPELAEAIKKAAQQQEEAVA